MSTVDAVQNRLLAVAVEQFEEAPLAGLDRRDLGAQIAHRALRQTDIHPDDVVDLLIDDAGAGIFHDRDLQSFGIDVGRDAAQRPADIRPMRHAAGKSDQRALVEDRQR